MSLRDLTAQKHKEAEETAFSQKLVSGILPEHIYADYLYQMFLIYTGLETACAQNGLLQDLQGLQRSPYIYADWLELKGDREYEWLPETHKYWNHIMNLNGPGKYHLLRAHQYTRYLGDLYGGQMIAKVVPGEARWYSFENAKQLKETLRSHLTDDLADEANLSFDMTIDIFNALDKKYRE